MSYYNHFDALILLKGIGAQELGYQFMGRFERSFNYAYQPAGGDNVKNFLEATRDTFTSLRHDENVSALPLGDAIALRNSQFNENVSRLRIEERLRKGENLEEIFPEAAKNRYDLSRQLADHDPLALS